MFLPSDSENDYDEVAEIEQSRFQNIELSSVVQSCRVFNDVPLNVEKSTQAMMNLLYLLHSDKGDLSVEEATDIFFMSTKLMQSTNLLLRRLHYILIKELAPKVEASYIASNSLMMDINNANPCIRGNALRTLFTVMDPSMYHSIDRTIIEKCKSMHEELSKAAYLTAVHLAMLNPEMAKKWVSHFSVHSTRSGISGTLMEYYCVVLHYITHMSSALAAKNLLSQFSSPSRNVELLLIRICADQLRQITRKDCGDISKEGSFFLDYLCSMLTLRKWSEVSIEACLALSSFSGLPDDKTEMLVKFLHHQLIPFSVEGHAVEKYVCITALAKIASTYPSIVEKFSWDGLSPFSTVKCIGARIIVILFHAGNQESIGALLKDLSTNAALKEMSADVKYTIINAIMPLQRKFPSLAEQIINFLFAALGEVENMFIKQRIIDTVIFLSKLDPGNKDVILTKLADSIDDCEFPAMTKRVLSHLSEQVPLCSNPRPYIRYVYNHCKLEQADIRATAVRTLAKIAAKLSNLRSLIVPLIMRCCTDEDDDVRDRAIFYTKLFCLKEEQLIQKYIIEIGEQVSNQGRVTSVMPSGLVRCKGADNSSESGAVSVSEALDGRLLAAEKGAVGSLEKMAPSDGSAITMSSLLLKGREEFGKVPPLRQLGTLLRSIEPVLLTDPDGDYAVSLMKHLTPTNVILQFRIHNAMDAASFTNVTIVCDTKELEVEPKFAIPIARIPPGAVQYAYVVLEYEEDVFPSGEVECHIRFAVQEDGEDANEDNETNDLEDFPIKPFDVEICDFLSPLALDSTFDEKWEVAKAEGEMAGTYELQSMKDEKTAEEEIAAFFGLHVKKVSHSLYMSGIAVNSSSSLVLIKAKVFISTTDAVVLQIAIRGGSEQLREFLTNSLLS